MQKTKSNGHAGPALPASAPPPAVVEAKPPPTPPSRDPFDRMKALVQQMVQEAGDKRYAEGFRSAAHIIARAFGQLDVESKAKLTKAMDQLEEELHKASTTAQ